MSRCRSRGAQLLAISVDSVYSHGAWAAVRGISFPLLADFAPKGEVARRYGVWREQDGFSERAGRLKVVKVNVDEAPAIAQRFGVQGIPLLVLMRDGAEVARLTGAAPLSRLNAWLNSQLTMTVGKR